MTLYIRRTKNARFCFDENLSSKDLFVFVLNKAAEGLRGSLKLGLRKRIFSGKGVTVLYRDYLKTGKNIVIGDFVKISALGIDGITLGDNVNVGSFSQIIVSAGLGNLGQYIRIGSNVGIGEFSYIGGGGGVTIGDDVIIGQYFSAHPENHKYTDTNVPIRLSGTIRRGIVIGNNCWIGSKVTILDGVCIGENCVIAAGTIVNKSIDANSVVGGVPGRVIKQIPPTQNA